MTTVRADKFQLSTTSFIELRNGHVAIIDNGVDLVLPAPLGPSGDPTYGSGRKAAMLDENWQSSGIVWWLRSTNGLIYPAIYTVSGVWEPGDVCACHVSWGSIALDFPHTVIQGDTNMTIAQAIRDAMANNATLKTAGITIMTVGAYGSGYLPASWHINLDYVLLVQGFNLSTSGSHSVNGAITPTPPANLLDIPGCHLRLSRAVDGRPQRANDFLCQITAEGQTSAPVGTNVQQIYGTIQWYVEDPNSPHPEGFVQLQCAAGNENNVINRVMVGRGLAVCDISGNIPQWGFMGPGTINVADDYFVNGVSVLDRIAALEARLAALGH